MGISTGCVFGGGAGVSGDECRMMTSNPIHDLMLQVSRTFFVVFMVTWFITRLYYFPAYVLNSTLLECLKVRPHLLHVQPLHGSPPQLPLEMHLME